jgi:cytochrome P450
LLDYTGELAAERHADPRDDLVTRIARAADEEGGWTEFEVRGFIAGLVFAGHETTEPARLDGGAARRATGSGTRWRAAGPAAEVVEEVMRLRGAATNVGRTLAEPVEVHGERLEAGTRVLLSLWSANRDETVYPKANELAPRENADVPHVGFGHGPYFCIGAALARAELQEALLALTARLDCPTIEAGAVWKPPVGINGPEVLPIRFTARDRRAAGGAG